MVSWPPLPWIEWTLKTVSLRGKILLERGSSPKQLQLYSGSGGDVQREGPDVLSLEYTCVLSPGTWSGIAVF